MDHFIIDSGVYSKSGLEFIGIPEFHNSLAHFNTFFNNIDEVAVYQEKINTQPLENNEDFISKYNELEVIISRIATTKNNIFDDDISNPSEDVVQKTFSFVNSLKKYFLFPDKINPSVEEGICLTFENGNYVLHFEIYNDGDLGYIIEDRINKEVVENEDVETLDQMINRINKFYK